MYLQLSSPNHQIRRFGQKLIFSSNSRRFNHIEVLAVCWPRNSLDAVRIHPFLDFFEWKRNESVRYHPEETTPSPKIASFKWIQTFDIFCRFERLWILDESSSSVWFDYTLKHNWFSIRWKTLAVFRTGALSFWPPNRNFSIWLQSEATFVWKRDLLPLLCGPTPSLFTPADSFLTNFYNKIYSFCCRPQIQSAFFWIFDKQLQHKLTFWLEKCCKQPVLFLEFRAGWFWWFSKIVFLLALWAS